MQFRPAYVLIPLGAIALTGGVLYGKEYLKRQQGALQSTKVRFEGFQVLNSDVAVQSITAKVFLAIKNLSDFSITIRRQEIDVFLNNEKIHDFKSTEPIVIASNGETVVGIPVTIQLKKTLHGILNAFAALPGLENLNIIVQGKLNIQSSGIYLNNFNFKIEKSLKGLFLGFKN